MMKLKETRTYVQWHTDRMNDVDMSSLLGAPSQRAGCMLKEQREAGN